jgi:hypothetical protein
VPILGRQNQGRGNCQKNSCFKAMSHKVTAPKNRTKMDIRVTIKAKNVCHLEIYAFAHFSLTTSTNIRLNEMSVLHTKYFHLSTAVFETFLCW